jgi:hypothetical protein
VPITGERQTEIPSQIKYAPPTNFKTVRISTEAASRAPMPNIDKAITVAKPIEPPKIVESVLRLP